MGARAAVNKHLPRGASPGQAGRIRVDTAAWSSPALVDQVLATYTVWCQSTQRGRRHVRAMVGLTSRGGGCALRRLPARARPGAHRSPRVRRVDQPAPVTAAGLRLGLGAVSPARRRADGGLDQRLSEEGDSSSSSRARLTASARLCTPSLAYMLRRWALIVFSDTNSSAAISGPRRLVGR